MQRSRCSSPAYQRTAREPNRTNYNAIYGDLEGLPVNVFGDIIDSELHARPCPRHALAATAIGGLIGSRYHWGTESGER